MTRRDTRLLAVAGAVLALLLLALVGLTRASSDPAPAAATTATTETTEATEATEAAGAGAAEPAGTGQGRSLAEAMAGDHAPVPDGSVAGDTQDTGGTAGPVVATGIPRERLATPEPGSRTEADGTVVLANGCLLHYGDAGQCLASVPRSAAEMGMTREQMPWQCEEVRLSFPDGLVVAPGHDTLALDTDGDGTACGPGDESGLMGSHSG